MSRIWFAAALVLVAAAFAAPALAASGGYIGFVSTGMTGVSCNESDLDYFFGFTADTEDSGGSDYVAVVTADAYGRPLDVDFLSAAVPGTYGYSDYTDFGEIFKIWARPVTIALFDIPYYGTLFENSVEAFDFVLAEGALLAEAVMDPYDANPSGCDHLPLMALFSFKAPVAEVYLGWPDDGRLNPHEGAPIAIYAVDEGVFEVWGIDINTGMGLLAFTADTTGLEAGDIPLVGAEGLNPYTFQPITMYLLPSGEFQINTYYWDGKPYIVTWPTESIDPGDLYIQEW
jgi:hypothetical protein